MALSPLYNVLEHPLISQHFLGLDGGETEQLAQNILAEQLLGLTAPAYGGDDAEKLSQAVALQCNFQVEQGLTPRLLKSQAQSVPGQTTTFHNRYVDPAAMAIVERVTERRTVRYTPFSLGT